MLTHYVLSAIRDANYEWMEEDRAFFATIEGLRGVWASAPTIETCRQELIDNLEAWIVFSLTHQIEIPVKGGVNLNLSRAEMPF